MDQSKTIMSLKNGLIENENFIIFGEDFARHPHALEHVLRPLFLKNKFIWVETIGLRSPRLSLYDLKRIAEKLSQWIGGAKKTPFKKSDIPENIFVIAPFMIPLNQFTLIRKFNQWMVVREVRKAQATHKITDPITIASVPNAADYIGSFEEKLKVYYCVDEFSLWPGLNKSLVEKLEKKLISHVDLILATSEYLAKSKVIAGKTTSIITHGVEFNHFNIGPNNIKDSKVKLCYFGLFDERSNQQIIKDIAEHIMNCEIHIFGNVVCDTKILKHLPNIIFHGNINYHALPSAILEMDIFLLPYVRNELTNNINPLKLKEYLSTGRPVIATELPEVAKLSDYLFLAKTSQDFISTIKKLLSNPNVFSSEKVIHFIKENETWEAKAKLLSSILTERK